MSRAVRGDVWAPNPRVLSLEEVMSVVVARLGVAIEDLNCHGRKAGVNKALAIECCCRFTPCTQRAVAKAFGYVEDSPVTRQRARLRSALKKDSHIQRIFRRLCKDLASAEEATNKV